MKKLRVGINGFGRIGRCLVREFIRKKAAGEELSYEITSVNNPGKLPIYLHLLKYDSVHGKLNTEIEQENDHSFRVGNHQINFHSHRNPAEIQWANDEVDIVIDSSGVFRDGPALSAHMGDTVKKVILCAPGKELDGTFVVGINDNEFDPAKHHIISNASCTTNCLAPVAKVLNDEFGIESGFMTTIHAYTNDQNLLDNSHKDTRRARAAALSMIPTSTGAAAATGLVIPELKGKLDGYAVRVPTADVSMVDLTVNLKSDVTKETINNAIKKASEGNLKGILAYTEEELVAADFTGRPESSIFDAPLTNVIDRTVKVVAWYDNEVGFTNRVLDLVGSIGVKTWG